VQVAPPIDPFQQMAQKSGKIVNIGARSSSPRQSADIGQRQLPLAEQGVGLGQQLARLFVGSIGQVAFTADNQQQGMHAGGIDRMNGTHAGTRPGTSGPVSSWIRAPKVVSSWAAADGGEWPDASGRW